MPHEGAEGPGIRVARSVAERAEQLDAPPALDFDPREPLLVLLDPHRRVARGAILPTGEPQENDLQMVFPGFLQEAVNKAELEFAFGGFHLRPRYAGQHAIQVARNQSWPDFLHVFHAGRGVVSHLSRHRQKRLAIHDQLRGSALFPEVRDARGGLSVARDRNRRRETRQRE